MRGRAIFGLALVVLLVARLAADPPDPPAPAPATAAVRELLERASKEAPPAALRTLEQARQAAEAAQDRPGLLAAADAAFRFGTARQRARDYAGAEAFHRFGLGIREREVPNTGPHADS